MVPRRIQHLLPKDSLDALTPELNKPIAMLQRIGDQFAVLYRDGHIHPQHLPLLEGSLQAFTDLQGDANGLKAPPFLSPTMCSCINCVCCFTTPLVSLRSRVAHTDRHGIDCLCFLEDRRHWRRNRRTLWHR